MLAATYLLASRQPNCTRVTNVPDRCPDCLRRHRHVILDQTPTLHELSTAAAHLSATRGSADLTHTRKRLLGRAKQAATRRDTFQHRVTWGMPMPATTRVVQIDPGPIPTLTASAPALIRSWHPSWVATFPATTSMSHCRLTSLTVSMTFFECP